MEHPLDHVGTLPRLPVPTWQQRRRAMEEFWRRRQEEIEATVNFRERAIPMARLKKVICGEKGKGKGSMMMTLDMPAFLSKACELFVQELAVRAWLCAESHLHRCTTILDSDIAEAIASTDSYDFLVDILHAHYRSMSPPHPKPTRKRPRPAADQPSTYHHQIPQFAPHIPPIPTPPMPTIFHHMPLSFPFLPQEASSPLSAVATATSCTPIATAQTNYITGCTLDLSGNNINTNNALANIVDGNNSIVTGATTTLAGPVGGLLNVPNIYFYMNMMSMMSTTNDGAACGAYGVGDASTSNVAAQPGDLTLPCPFNPPFPLHHSCPLPVANSNDPAIATTVELNHILPKGAETNTIRASRTAKSCGDNDVAAAAIGVDDGQQQQQQQQEKETAIDDHQNVVHESVGAETIVAAGAEGNKNNIGEDEIEVFDESLLDKFLEEIQIDDDLLSPDTTSADFLSFISTIPDMEEWINDPYLLDDVFSNPSTSSK